MPKCWMPLLAATSLPNKTFDYGEQRGKARRCGAEPQRLAEVHHRDIQTIQLFSVDTDNGVVSMVTKVRLSNAPRGSVNFTKSRRGFVSNIGQNTISEIDPDRPAVEIAVLGPLHIMRDGAEIPLTRTQALALLALVCAGGHPVTKDALHRKVYGREPDNRSVQTLRRHVANLRAAIGGHVVKTTSLAGTTAYRLELSGVRLDASRFQELAQAGTTALHGKRLADAAALAGDAIALWRGRPMPELPERSFAADRITRLESWHQNAARVHAEALIRLGRCREILTDLSSLTRTYPDDGLLRRLLVIALYADHRDGSASEALQDASKAFVDEGLHPGYFHPLHQQVLNMTLPRDGATAIDLTSRPATAPGSLP